MQKFEKIDIKQAEEYIKRINRYFEKLKNSIDIETQSDLEYEIYYFASAISELTKKYTRNLYRINKEFDTRFLIERPKYNSDLTTTKKVKKDLIQEYTEIEIQEEVIGRLKDRKKDIHRLANFINDERINELAMNKRQPQ
jgi:hypothetical protein